MSLLDRVKSVFGVRPSGTIINPQQYLDGVGIDEFVNNIPSEQREALRESLWSRFEFDTPYARTYDFEKLGVPGKFTILREWTWVERLEVLERCHQAWERNPLANTAVSYTTQFAIGDGGILSFGSNEVKDVITEFINDPENNFRAYEKEFCDALQVDGEVFVRFFSNAQGRVTIVPIRPWHIQWFNTDPEFWKRVISYHYVYMIVRDKPGESDFGMEDIPADEVIHFAINRLPYELRGRSELFRILPWLKAYKDWLEDRARLNKRKGAILYDVTLKNANPGSVSAKRAQYQNPPSPGSLAIHNENETWQVLSAKIEAGDAAEDGRQMKLMAAAGIRLPEYMFADGANANLATSTSQQLPALKKFSNFQDMLVLMCWKPIFRKVIEIAVKKGRIEEKVQMVDENGDPVYQEPNFPGLMAEAVRLLRKGRLLESFSLVREAVDTGASPKMINAVDAFDYNYPDLRDKDPQSLAQAMAIVAQNEWASDETISRDMGFNPVVEKAKILRQKGEKAAQNFMFGNMGGASGGQEDTNVPPAEGESASTSGGRTGGFGGPPVAVGSGTGSETAGLQMAPPMSPIYSGNAGPGGSQQ